MGVTVQVRNLESDVQAVLVEAAKAKGLSLSEFLRQELTSLAELIEVRKRFEQLTKPRERAPLAHVSSQEIVDIIREARGE
jgi:uncharacterized protein (DUF1778 family)